MLLFVYVFGGAIQTGTASYVNYLLPGILLIAIASAVAYTAYRLFNDVQKFVLACDRCQLTENISRKNEMPLTGILEVEPFNVWGMDFMGPFPISF